MWEVLRSAALHTAREVRRRPLHAAVVVGTLAIAIGANAALFTVTKALLFERLPYEDANRIVRVQGMSVVSMTADAFAVDQEFADLPGVVETSYFTPDAAGTLTASRNRRVNLAYVAPNFFEVMGVRLTMGAGLGDVAIGTPAAVIGHSVWANDFGSDPDILERDLVLNGVAFRIVGVAPREVAWPSAAEAWLGYPVQYEFMGSAFGAHAVARLAPGADRAEAESRLQAVQAPRVAEWEAEGYVVPPSQLVPIREELAGSVKEPILVLFGAAGIVLLLGALNLTSVWLHRVIERDQELRTRRALGASRARLVLQIVAEAVFLSAIGGVAALGVARLGTDLVTRWLPTSIPGASDLGPGPTTIAFALGLAVFLGACIGGLAALRGSPRGVAGARRDRSVGRARTEFALLLGQAALAAVLVAGSVMTTRSFQQLVGTSLGFEPEGTVAFSVQIPRAEAEGREAILGYYETLAAELRAVPGVETLAITSRLPLSTGIYAASSFRPEGVEVDERLTGYRYFGSDDYFEAAGVRLLAGRGFGPDWGDSDIVIDRDLAALLFPDVAPGSVIGRTIEQEDWNDGVQSWVPFSIRGVIEGVRVAGARNGVRPAFYQPIEYGWGSRMSFVARVRGEPAAFVSAFEDAVRTVNPRIVPDGVRSLRDDVGNLLATDRALASVISGFSVAGLLLAALGLYGVTGRQIASRRKELGVRLALGADPGQLIGRVVRGGVTLGLAAVLLAIPGVVLGGRALADRLFEVPAVHLPSMATAAILVVAVTTIASWIPARRVTRISPRDALTAD